ncbi:unnamed protein product [Scytosiphon promiscuus]
MSFVRSDDWVAKRHLQTSFKPTASGGKKSNGDDSKMQTLGNLCLRSLESSLGKGVASFDLEDLPFGIAETIYEFVSKRGSRMARMEILRALAPILRQHVNSLDFSGAKVVGDSALLELANGCGSSLAKLDLSGCCFVSDHGMLAALLKCPGLVDLTLSGCSGITDQTIFHLPHRCTSLRELNLAGLDGITDHGVAYVSFLSSLEKLCLAKCKISDTAVVTIATGACCQSLRWLDLTGTGIGGACTASLRSARQLEYLALSSTDACVSVMSVAALARDLRLPAALPEAPKTRARSSRALLQGSKWSKRQLSSVPRRRTGATAPARSWQNSAPTICYERDGPSKAMRLLGAAGRASSSASSSLAADDRVEVGFKEAGVEESGRKLLLSLVQDIVRLWPAVPAR